MSEFQPLIVLFDILLIVSPWILYFHYPRAALNMSLMGILLLLLTLVTYPDAISETRKELSKEWQRKLERADPPTRN